MAPAIASLACGAVTSSCNASPSKRSRTGSRTCGQHKATPVLHPSQNRAEDRHDACAPAFMVSSRVERPLSKLTAQTLWRLFTSTPDDLDVVTELESRAATGSWGEIIKQANEILAELVGSKRAAACMVLARWYGEMLGFPEYAAPYLADALRIAPGNTAARMLMARLLPGRC